MKKALYLLSFIAITTTIIIAYIFYTRASEDPKDLFSKKIIKAREYRNKNSFDSAIYFAKQDLSKNDIPYNTSYINNLIGYSFFALKEYDSAYFYYTKLVLSTLRIDEKYFKEGLSLKATACNQIGLIFREKNLHNESIPYFQKAVEIFEKLKKSSVCAAYYNLAFSQSKVNNINCIESYYKALEYATKYQNPKYEMICMSNIGYLMLETQNLDAAIGYFNAALETEYSKNHPIRKSICYQGLADSYYDLKKYDKAQEWAEKSLNLKLNENIEDYLFITYYLLGKIYRDNKEPEKSEDHFKKAVIYFDQTKRNRQTIAVFKDLSDLQLKMGKPMQSATNSERHFKELEKFVEQKQKAQELAKSDSNLLSSRIEDMIGTP